MQATFRLVVIWGNAGSIVSYVLPHVVPFLPYIGAIPGSVIGYYVVVLCDMCHIRFVPSVIMYISLWMLFLVVCWLLCNMCYLCLCQFLLCDVSYCWWHQ